MRQAHHIFCNSTDDIPSVTDLLHMITDEQHVVLCLPFVADNTTAPLDKPSAIARLQEQLPDVVRTSRGLSIAETRIILYSIMDYVKAGWPPKLIRDRLNLIDRQITDALGYIADHRTEVEAEYQQVLREADEIRQYWEERYRERLAAIAALPPKPEQAAVRAKLAAATAKLGEQ
ncbi:MAG: hypothetical protein MI924_21455 [Chloroflexales bacterium]|nr:hypothetical protein [Chloroflexales bacterium]